jgi:hypothetical protein
MLSGNSKKNTARKSSENSDCSLSDVQAEKMVAIDHSINKFAYFSNIFLFKLISNNNYDIF